VIRTILLLEDCKTNESDRILNAWHSNTGEEE